MSQSRQLSPVRRDIVRLSLIGVVAIFSGYIYLSKGDHLNVIVNTNVECSHKVL